MSAEFVACMEDVLDLYAEPYDPKRPVVCFVVGVGEAGSHPGQGGTAGAV